MIKIEITDPHLLDKKAIQETAKYLMALTGGQLAIPAERKVNVGDISEQAADFKKIAENIANNIVRPALSIDAQLDMHQLNGTDPFELEEELIPVPPEVVNIPTPTAAEIFNPVNGLNLPPVPKPSVELDAAGMPWDKRIHARTKTKMKDGTWKKARNIGPLVVKHVEEELKHVQSIPVPPVCHESTDAPATFADLMTLVTQGITSGKLKRDQIVSILEPFGPLSLPLVATRLDLIPELMKKIKEVIDGTL